MTDSDLLAFSKFLPHIEQIDGWMWRNELITLFRHAQLAVEELQPGEQLIEIGSWEGRSTLAIAFACKHNKKGKLYTVDPFNLINSKNRAGKAVQQAASTAEKHLHQNIAKHQFSKYISPLHMTSEVAFEKYKDSKSRFIFIDGDHQLESIQYDAAHWPHTLVDNGYLLFHDTIDSRATREMFFQFLLKPRYVYRGTTGNVSAFQKKSQLSPRNWVKKLFSYCVFSLFFTLYTPTLS